MLRKEWISGVQMHSEDWFTKRLSKFTSSEWHLVMGERGIGEGGKSYIYRKVGELLTGIVNKKEIATEATEHGNLYELENLRMFAKVMGLGFLVTQKLIAPQDSKHSSTPDALIVNYEAENKEEYSVSTVEAKCPLTYDNYIKLWKCRTPFDVKKVKPEFYWQTLHQMWVCDSLVGYLSVYHPHFRVGQLRIIEFKKIDLVSEFKLLKQRAIEAELLFDETVNEMMKA